MGIPDRQCRRLLSRYNQSGPLKLLAIKEGTPNEVCESGS
ncbi:hypothetical protein ACHB9H_001199 [Klebsiella pneumoniae]